MRERAEAEREEARAHLADALEERATMARDLADAKAANARLEEANGNLAANMNGAANERDEAKADAEEAWGHVQRLDAVNAGLHKDLADAQAEVERLREQLRDTLEERATMARDVERLSASDVALGKVELILEDAIGFGPWGSAVTMARRVRLDVDELRRLAWQWCIDCKACADYGYHALGDVLRLRAEADELRALAWEWCIEARSGREALEPHERNYSKLYHEFRIVEDERDELRAQFQRLTDDAYEVDHRGNCPEPRSSFDDMAERAGPLPTAVLAQTEPPAYGPTTTAHEVTLRDEPPIDPAALRIDPWCPPVVVQEPGRLVRTEPPIGSLGPVPVDADVLESLHCHDWADQRIAECVEWLVRDAVRRGAKLEGT